MYNLAEFFKHRSKIKILSCRNEVARARVASNPSTPVDILMKLSADEYEYSFVRRCVAENLSTPVEILKILSTDKDSVVREYVDLNPNWSSRVYDI